MKKIFPRIFRGVAVIFGAVIILSKVLPIPESPQIWQICLMWAASKFYFLLFCIIMASIIWGFCKAVDRLHR